MQRRRCLVSFLEQGCSGMLEKDFLKGRKKMDDKVEEQWEFLAEESYKGLWLKELECRGLSRDTGPRHRGGWWKAISDRQTQASACRMGLWKALGSLFLKAVGSQRRVFK